MPRRNQQTEADQTAVTATPASATVRTWRARIAVYLAAVTLVILFASYYFWIVAPCSVWQPLCAPNGIRDYSQRQVVGAYNLLAVGLLSGRLALPLDPNPMLLNLPDPYDPEQNKLYRFHDASLYKGKLYLPFGPIPALLLYAPYYFITATYLPDVTGCALLALLAYLATCGAMRLMLRVFFPSLPGWMVFFLCFSFGFCNSYPYMLRRPAMYETAIFGGQFCLAASIWLIARAVLGSGRRPLVEAAVGGLLGAMAFASRPPVLMAAGVVLLLILFSPPVLDKGRIPLFVCALVPFIAGCLMVAWYNDARFDSPFEFGYAYQLAGYNSRTAHFFRLSRLPVNLYLDLFSNPSLSSTFPFLFSRANAPFKLPPNELGFDPITGIVWLCPSILSLLSLRWMLKTDRRLAVWVIALLTGAFAILCVDGSLSTTMRYQADVSNLVLLAGGLGIGFLLTHIPPNRRTATYVCVLLLVSFGIILNAAYGMTGYSDTLKAIDPNQYKAIESVFRPISSLLAAVGVKP